MVDYSFLDGKKILVTGASGLIGRAIVTDLLLHKWMQQVKVIACVRNKEKADRAFAGLPTDNLDYIVGDVCDLALVDMGVDYVIHGASITASRSFIENPVEVINNSVKSTERLLEFARVNNVKSFVYLSSMEIYGTHIDDDKIYEDDCAYIDTMNVRASYPESKRLCECLCASYYSQFGVPTKVLRLTQTFGASISYDDKRVFAEFARCVIEGKDIILKTKGETKHNYLYIDDAVSATFTVLGYGKNGEAYNAANEDTYCSIYDVASLIANQFGNGKIKVVIDESNAKSCGYAATAKMNIATDKLKALGWQAEIDLISAFEKTIHSMKNNCNG